MARAIRARAAATQFSAPTHRGRLDRPAGSGRARGAGVARRASLGLSDQILALLRLAPDHRAEALEAARNIAGEWGAALRYALGGSEPIGKTAALWIAAARARAPFEDDPKVRGLLAESTLGGDLAPRFSWSTRPRDGGWVELFLHAGDPVGMGVNFGKEGLGGKHLPAPTAPIDEARCLATVAMSDPGLLCCSTPMSGATEPTRRAGRRRCAAKPRAAVRACRQVRLPARRRQLHAPVQRAAGGRLQNHPRSGRAARPDGAADALPGAQRHRQGRRGGAPSTR